MSELRALIGKEITLEWRQRYALNGMLLYVVSTVAICYASFSLRQIADAKATWNALFWIILLFTAVSAIAKSFGQERAGRLLYYYTLASPQGIILAKMLYNAGLMLGLALLGFGFYAAVMGNPVADGGLFALTLVLGAVGFASTLTLVAGIAAKAPNNGTLMAVLSFPVMLPTLLILIRLSKNALDGLDRGVSTDEIVTLLAINAIVATLSYLLFPYLWRT